MNLRRRWQALFRKRELEADMAEEMRLHLEMLAERKRAEGLSAEEARFAARREFGGVEQIKERAREQRFGRWLEQAWRDLAFAVRSLARARGFALTAISDRDIVRTAGDAERR